tara:strand:- start:139 stop:420 length:282 start_codon:yes stop_codon:yes gene_type:complete
MSRLIPSYIEQGLLIEHLERELAEAKEQLRLCNVDQFTTAAELAEARKDAERYRWLRERHENTIMDIYNSISPAMKPELLDAAIDAAMKEGGK